MSESDLKRAFLRQGLESYPAALTAVEFFQREITEKLRQALEDKADWKNFRRASERGELVPATIGRPTGASARWITVYLQGEKRGEDTTWLYLGLYWNAVKTRVPVVAWAHFTVGSRVVAPIDLPERDPRVKVGPLERNEKRLYIVPNADFDPDADFALLLESLDAAISPQETTTAAGT